MRMACAISCRSTAADALASSRKTVMKGGLSRTTSKNGELTVKILSGNMKYRLRPDHLGKPAADGYNDRVGGKIRSEYPSAVVRRSWLPSLRRCKGTATLATLVSRTSTAAIDQIRWLRSPRRFTLGSQMTCSDGRVSAVALIANKLSLRHSYPAEAGGPRFSPGSRTILNRYALNNLHVVGRHVFRAAASW